MRVVILSARTGWQTDELIRALTARGHLAALVPYEGLTARVGGSGLPASTTASARLTSEQISLLDADAVLARIIPGGSLEQLIYRVDALQTALESKAIPFVVITGYPRVLVRRDHRQPVLSKPVSAEALTSTVRALSGA